MVLEPNPPLLAARHAGTGALAGNLLALLRLALLGSLVLTSCRSKEGAPAQRPMRQLQNHLDPGSPYRRHQLTRRLHYRNGPGGLSGIKAGFIR